MKGLGGRRLAAIAAVQLMLFVGCATASADTGCADDGYLPASAADASRAAFALVCDINAARSQAGLKPVTWNWKLWSAAEEHATDMADHHFVSHIGSDGRSLAERVLPTGYAYQTDNPDWFFSENIAWGTNSMGTAMATAVGWMNSDGHRVNMLDPDVSDVGIGMAQGSAIDGGASGWFYVADFGTPGTPPAPRAAQSTAARRNRVSQRKHARRHVKLHRRVRPRW